QDHQNLVALSHSQKGLIEQDDLRRRLAVDKEDQKLVSCGTEKASLQGANGVLSNQNRDQQNTINNCQTQALKLLAPEPLKVVPLLLEPGNGGMEMQHVEFLLLTNRVITPINLVVSCQDRIADLNASIVGSGVTAGGSSRISKNQFQVNISSPAWGPEAPMIISMSFIGYSDNPCSFNER
ncbi:MAG TPA: hypothetical protein VFU68_09180, partial [Terracidiphilus sp.]|nr:hypothetical protein [Terracidiphilus sp.]